VTVAEEQYRQATADQDNPVFVPASSAAMEAYVMSQKEEKPDIKLHPLFRRRSSSVSSTSASKAPQQVKKSTAKKGKNGKIKEEEIYEVLSSDEEVVNEKKGKGKETRENSVLSEGTSTKSEEAAAT
jgi:hypothetical protein